MANTVLPATIAYTAAIPFNQPVTKIGDHTVSGPITLTKVTTDAEVSFGAILRLTADGTNTPDFSAFKKIGTGSWVNTAGTVNQCWFIFDGNDYCVAFTQPVAITGGGGGGDTTPPTIIGAVATDLHTISITGSETLVGSSGFTFKKNGVAMTQTGVSSPTGTVRTYTFSDTMLSTDTITFDYAPGDVTDAATTPNALVAFTGHAVTNSIPGSDANLLPGFTYMAFPTVDHLVETSTGSHIWKSTVAAPVFNGFGKESKKAPINDGTSATDFFIGSRFDGTLVGRVGIKRDDLAGDNYDMYIYFETTGDLVIRDYPTVVTIGAAVSGTWYLICRRSGVFTVESTTDFVSFTVLYTFVNNIAAINSVVLPVGVSTAGDTTLPAPYAITYPQYKGLV